MFFALKIYGWNSGRARVCWDDPWLEFGACPFLLGRTLVGIWGVPVYAWKISGGSLGLASSCWNDPFLEFGACPSLLGRSMVGIVDEPDFVWKIFHWIRDGEIWENVTYGSINSARPDKSWA